MLPLNIVGDFLEDAQNIADGAKQIADFASDPLGSIAQTIQDANLGLTKVLLPWMIDATRPDLTLSWFLQSYAVAFAIAMVLLAIVLMHQFYRAGKSPMGGIELGQSLMQYLPTFLLGAAFGPIVGRVIVDWLGALTDSLISWGVAGGTEGVVRELSDLITAQSPDQILGGVFMAIIISVGFFFGLMVVFVVLLFQLVTLYFVGAAFPIMWMFIVDPERRETGFQVVKLWILLLAGHPLVFFFMGMTFKFAGAAIGGEVGDNKPLAGFVESCVLIIALVMVSIAPFKLVKFANIQGAAAASKQPDVAGNVSSYGASSVQQYLTNNNRYSSSSSNTSVNQSSAPPAASAFGGSPSRAASPSGSPFAEALSRGASTASSAGTTARAASVASAGASVGAGVGSVAAGGAGLARAGAAAGGPVGTAAAAGVSVAAKSIDMAKKVSEISTDMASTEGGER